MTCTWDWTINMSYPEIPAGFNNSQFQRSDLSSIDRWLAASSNRISFCAGCCCMEAPEYNASNSYKVNEVGYFSDVDPRNFEYPTSDPEYLEPFAIGPVGKGGWSSLPFGQQHRFWYYIIPQKQHCVAYGEAEVSSLTRLYLFNVNQLH